MAFQIRHIDKVASLLLILLAAGVFVASRNFPSGITGTPGPAFFPRVIAASIAGVAAFLFIRSVTTGDDRTQRITTEETKRVVVPIALLVGYALLLPVLGFLLDTFAFLIVTMWYSGATEARTVAPLAAGIALVLQYVFVEFLHVPLPAGSILPVARWLPPLPIVSGVLL
ncbi:tripartite tricarboxylate transporter TctB family protein (plasmid) [Halorussus limi]|uniref:Tripartite tricarboxylate transporter TctB family protein n=1 Tax=Halorussus limi TaxID=2938695 RepID=A0A8U0I0B4_9EURY|nr:tripartite tricarboxylate transporter TctB family protein [Halorussus limi]UPV76617.1 tripartite tricarboxylate transporter TctB family protein [Halorussus limi]